MKKNGFTLVELLGVIAILALLATIATPAIIALSNKIKSNMYDAKVKLIKESAILYVEKSNVSLEDFYLNSLCKNGIITPDEGITNNGCASVNATGECGCLKNPKNNEAMGSCKIKVTKSNGRYSVEFPISGADDACK